MDPLLTVNMEQTPEGVFVYCPELDIYTAGADQAEAERKFVSLLFEYYDTLDHNRARLDEIMRSHLEFYERKLFPEMLSLSCLQINGPATSKPASEKALPTRIHEHDSGWYLFP